MNRILLSGLMLMSGAAMGQTAPTAPTTPTTAPAKQPATAGVSARNPLPDATAKKAKEIRTKAIDYLRSKQDRKLGAWGVKDGVAAFPAITGLCVTGMLMEPGASDDADGIGEAITYLLTTQKPDGGFYTAALPTYNTAITMVALSKSGAPMAKEAIRKAQTFLKKLQFAEDAGAIQGVEESPQAVTKDHVHYGAWGYGRHGRPDLSNTQWALEALHASGVPSDDASFQRALVFLQRCQMVDSVNDQTYADGSTQGGFIYSTSENKDKVGIGQSQAGVIEETLSDGTKASKLRAYGSMTYSGFKSYLYAGLKKDDPRVVLAKKWISENYTLAENPGMGTDGYYYYLVAFARAMEASGETSIQSKGETKDWRVDLIDKLAELQNEDGSFKPFKDRWLENDPVLITAYALIAAQNASK